MAGIKITLLTGFSLMATMVGLGFAQDQNMFANIRWKGSQYATENSVQVKDFGVFSDYAEKHMVVQFKSIPTASKRQELQGANIHLLRYLGNNAYFAKVAGHVMGEKVARQNGIDKVLEINHECKLHPFLLADEIPSSARMVAGDDDSRTRVFRDGADSGRHRTERNRAPAERDLRRAESSAHRRPRRHSPDDRRARQRALLESRS